MFYIVTPIRTNPLKIDLSRTIILHPRFYGRDLKDTLKKELTKTSRRDVHTTLWLHYRSDQV
jgi:hypothetical protein